MIDKYLAIVTARSGSKRLPGKNVREVCGKPLFVWSVLAGLNCPHVARTIVSTDSVEYQRIAIEAGADCPWLRDPALAADDTSSADVVKDVLHKLGDEVRNYRAIVLLQPTSPLRTSADISGAIALYEERNAPAVISVSEAECPPAWMGELSSNLAMDEFLILQHRNLRSQDYGRWYRINGAIYVISVDRFRLEHGFKPNGALAYVMPRERSVDVDTAYDLELAELLMKHLNSQIS